jgi:phosphoribosylformimino-5-aminoimidazole carboxamide ribotide isomerase
MGMGPDLATMKALCTSRRLRVIASGGIRDVGDLEGIERVGAAGAVIGRALYDGGVSLREAKAALGRES